MPKQANEYISEIEFHFTRVSGMMCSSWRIDHVLFLIQRAKFKSRSEECVVEFEEEHIPRIKACIQNKRGKVSVYRSQIERLLELSQINYSFRKIKEIVLDSEEIHLCCRNG